MVPPTLATKSPSSQAQGLVQPRGRHDTWLQPGARPHCLGKGQLRTGARARSSEPRTGTRAVTEVHGEKEVKMLKGTGVPRGPACPPHLGSQVKLPIEHYQIHQHLHHPLCHKVLGVIQQNTPMVGVQCQAAER